MFGFKVHNILITRCIELLSYFEALLPRMSKYFNNIMSWYKDGKLEEFERYLIETLEVELKKQGIRFIVETENNDIVLHKFIYKEK